MEEKFKEVIEEFKNRTEKECYKISIVDGSVQIEEDIKNCNFENVLVDWDCC